MEIPPLLFTLGEAPEEPEHTRVVLVLELAGELFAVDIAEVSEVLRDYRVHAVPGALPQVDGILNLRGRVVTVLSGRRLLGLAGEPPAETERVLVLEWEGELLGVRVDRIVGVRRFPPSALEPPLPGEPEPEGALVLGLVNLEGRAVSLLALAKAATAPLGPPPVSTARTGFAVDNT